MIHFSAPDRVPRTCRTTTKSHLSIYLSNEDASSIDRISLLMSSGIHYAGRRALSNTRPLDTEPDTCRSGHLHRPRRALGPVRVRETWLRAPQAHQTASRSGSSNSSAFATASGSSGRGADSWRSIFSVFRVFS